MKNILTFVFVCVSAFASQNINAQCSGTLTGPCYNSDDGLQAIMTDICPTSPTDVVTLNFTAGSTESCCDEVVVYSGASGSGTGGSEIYNQSQSSGSMSGLSFTSSAAGQCLSVYINADGSVDCGTSGAVAPSATVSCMVAPLDPCASGAADDCNNATPLDLTSPFMGTTDCGYTVDNAPGSFCGSVDNNSWFSLVAGATDVVIDWDITGGSNCASGIQLGVFEGTCGSLSLVGSNCEGQTGGIGSAGTFTMSSLTVGNTYLLMIDGFGGNLCEYSITPVGGVAVTPDNDDCANATAITCGSTTTSDNILATAGDAPGACGDAGGAGAGVWYTFTGDGSNVTLSTDAAGTSFDTELTVWTGTCGALTCSAGDDDGGTGTTSELSFTSTNGTVYYVYVSGASGATGAFDLSLTCVTPVTGNECTDPITVPVMLTSGVACTPGQVVDLGDFTESIAGHGCGPNNLAGHDVWFSVTIPASGQATFLTGNGGAGETIDTYVEVYEPACDGTETSCQDLDNHDTFHETITVTGTAGDVFLFRVGAMDRTTPPLNVVGDFAVCAYDPVAAPVTGDACTDPITVPVALTSGVACTPAQVVDLSAFTNSLSEGIVCSTIEPGSGDIWFDITLPASGQATFLTDQGGDGSTDDTWVEVYETACDGTEVSCQDDDAHATLSHEIITVTGTAGDVVRLRVGATNNSSGIGDFAVCAYDPVVPAADVSLSIADPCDCTNKIVVGGVEYAQEIITITPGAAPYTVTAVAGLYTAAGVLYTPATATAAIVTGPSITLTGYVPADNTATYSITVQDGNSSTDSISGGPCASCCAADNGVWQP